MNDTAPILVRYLSLAQSPSRFSRRPLKDVTIRREQLDAEGYLSLYRAVGEPYGWDQRQKMSREALSRYLADPRCDLFILRNREDGTAWGLCEFDSRYLPSVELVNFGLMASAQGRGLGSAFLQEALSALWQRRKPQYIWLHTDEWDHPRALTVYQRAGFTIEREIHQDPTDL